MGRFDEILSKQNEFSKKNTFLATKNSANLTHHLCFFLQCKAMLMLRGPKLLQACMGMVPDLDLLIC